MLKKSLYTAIFILGTFWTYAQDINNPKILNELKSEIETLIIDNNFSKADEKNNSLLSLSMKEQKKDLELDCYLKAAYISIKQKRKERALKNYLRALSVSETIKEKPFFYEINEQVGDLYGGYKAHKKSLEYYKAALSHSNSNVRKSDINKLYNKTGNAFFNLQQYDSALFYYKKIENSAVEKKDTLVLSESVKPIIYTLRKQKKYKEALVYQYILYDIYLRKKNDMQVAATLNNIAFDYVITQEYEKAITAYKETEKYKHTFENDSYFKGTICMNTAVCYQNTGEFEKAVQELLKAEEIWLDANNKEKLSETYNFLALIYLKNDDIYNAGEFADKAIETAKETQKPELLMDCYLTRSEVYKEGYDHEKAFETYSEYLNIRDSLLTIEKAENLMLKEQVEKLQMSEQRLQEQISDEKIQEVLIDKMKLEAEQKEKDMQLLKQENDLKESEKEIALQALALSKQKHFAEMREQQILSLKQEKAIQELELKQKEAIEKEKQKEIELLNAQTEKQNLEIEKKNLAIEKKDQEAVHFRRMLIAGGILLLLGLYFLIITRKKNKKLSAQKKRIEQINEELNQQNEEISSQKEYLQKANTQISAQKNEIEQKQEEITDSIKYAYRIQTAVMPDLSALDKLLNGYFVFYKPRDIVSGDFYWMKIIGDNIVIAAADCTGHGVPGAFMSMLGMSFLNEIVTKTRFDDAGKILDRLRKKVKNSLKQTGKLTEQKDGMDISLLIINTGTKKLQFAGANNPLLLIRNNEMNLIKADRMPIGIYHKENPFQNIVFDVEENDTLYIFSDGFQDQFGGPNGRKYLSKRFKDLLFKISSYPVEKQSEILEKEYNDWLAYESPDGQAYRQIDDILIIGLKI